MKETKDIQIVKRENNLLQRMEPQYSIAQMKEQREQIKILMREVMIEGQDYGVIPGCGKKPALLKPGSEKTCYYFGLGAKYDIKKIPFENGHMEYEIICTLEQRSSGMIIGEGLGSCSTLESKYRYRWDNTEKPVPSAYWDTRDKALLGGPLFTARKIQSKWMIFQKVEHDNPADYYNTCLKMAKKRAYVDATLTGTAASELFTQDIEDMKENEEKLQTSYSAPRKTSGRPKKDSSLQDGLSDAVQRDLEKLENAQSLEELTTAYEKAFAKVKALKDGQGMTVITNKRNERKHFLENVPEAPDEDVPF